VADDKGKEEEQFNFTPEGEELGYISLAQARLVAIQTARARPARRRWIRRTRMVFQFLEEQDDEDFFTISLSFRPEGNFVGAPGQEQFIISRIGVIEYRGVLSHPKRNINWPVKRIVATMVLMAGGITASFIADDLIDKYSTPSSPPPATKTPPPSATKTLAPSATKTLAPSATKTLAPSATKTLAPSATKTPTPSATTMAEIMGVSFLGASGYALSLSVESIPEEGNSVYLMIRMTTLNGLTFEKDTQFIRAPSGVYHGTVVVDSEFIEDADLDSVLENVTVEILPESR
jgi:hypothetical protein